MRPFPQAPLLGQKTSAEAFLLAGTVSEEAHEVYVTFPISMPQTLTVHDEH